MDRSDIVVIGAGVIGLAVARAIAGTGKSILVLEQHDSFGKETSSRNSEVIHAGLYYPKDSLKARTCIRGRHLLYELCVRNNIPHKKTGKLLVACNKTETAKLEDIYRNASDCGVTGLELIDKPGLSRKYPYIKGDAGLFSPDTGIIDSHSLMKYLFTSASGKGADIAFNIEVVGIKRSGSGYILTVKEPQGDLFSFEAGTVINSAGLYSDKIAVMAGLDTKKLSYTLHYCKGQYFRIRDPKKFRISIPVYPPPTNTDLGIHITPDLAGGLRLGPDAAYVNDIDYNVDGSALKVFWTSAKRFLPSLEEADLIPDTAGIRPKLQNKNDPFRDFILSEETGNGLPGFINLIGIESPGLTACLAIAEEVKALLG
ncbi:MAG: NAD(P)/FAD-dependent oxidoreductase [Candidatus Omnitrophota bacterium]